MIDSLLKQKCYYLRSDKVLRGEKQSFPFEIICPVWMIPPKTCQRWLQTLFKFHQLSCVTEMKEKIVRWTGFEFWLACQISKFQVKNDSVHQRTFSSLNEFHDVWNQGYLLWGGAMH